MSVAPPECDLVQDGLNTHKRREVLGLVVRHELVCLPSATAGTNLVEIELTEPSERTPVRPQGPEVGFRALSDSTPMGAAEMVRLIRARKCASRGSGALVVVLAACMMSSLGESANAGGINAIDGLYPAATAGDLLKTTAVDEGSEPFFVLGTTPTDLHRLIEGVRAPPTGSGCAHWPGPDSLAGMLVPLPGAAWLLVGGRGVARPGTDDFSSGNVQRRYPVLTSRRSGFPRVGEIALMVLKAQAAAERRCVERLRGIPVRWLNRAGDRDAFAGPAIMVVRDVEIRRAAVTGSAREPVATGDMVVVLSFAEGFMSMVWREMKAQRWGIAGGLVSGVLLTILTWVGGGMLRKLRKLKIRNRSARETSVHDTEQQGEDDGGPENACPPCREGVSGGAGPGEKDGQA